MIQKDRKPKSMVEAQIIREEKEAAKEKVFEKPEDPLLLELAGGNRDMTWINGDKGMHLRTTLAMRVRVCVLYVHIYMVKVFTVNVYSMY